MNSFNILRKEDLFKYLEFNVFKFFKVNIINNLFFNIASETIYSKPPIMPSHQNFQKVIHRYQKVKTKIKNLIKITPACVQKT